MNHEHSSEHSGLLGASDIRRIASLEGIRPTKKFGQNFVIDPGTVRKIVRAAGITAASTVLEVGPGLGSLTLAILETGAQLTVVEIDPALAQRLPQTIREYMPDAIERLHIVLCDALKVQAEQLTALQHAERCSLVANLPYNVATPIIITLLERFPQISDFVVMVQKEVADRLTAGPGSRIYGTPSVKLQWFGQASKAGTIGRNVFWPAPNVDSALVAFTRTHTDTTAEDVALRERTFSIIDKAFAARRKTLHAALRHEIHPEALQQAGIDPSVRGETLTCAQFTDLARADSELRAQTNDTATMTATVSPAATTTQAAATTRPSVAPVPSAEQDGTHE